MGSLHQTVNTMTTVISANHFLQLKLMSEGETWRELVLHVASE